MADAVNANSTAGEHVVPSNGDAILGTNPSNDDKSSIEDDDLDMVWHAIIPEIF
jgi:hypothetical protein